ncbi:MAG: hypothetical protein Q8R82_07110 [Hyphomonadaceae bacterium]|nr:hypothetical protein [Hyphomonadaceae bacterium]
MSDYQKATDAAMHTLEQLEEGVNKHAESFGVIRKRADDLYQSRVAQIAKANNVDVNKAHALAVDDPVASRAYALSEELAERQNGAHDAGEQIAAYLD